MKKIIVRNLDFGNDRKKFIITSFGKLEVTACRVLGDGPWVVCGRENGGFGQSFCVAWNTEILEEC